MAKEPSESATTLWQWQETAGEQGRVLPRVVALPVLHQIAAPNGQSRGAATGVNATMVIAVQRAIFDRDVVAIEDPDCKQSVVFDQCRTDEQILADVSSALFERCPANDRAVTEGHEGDRSELVTGERPRQWSGHVTAACQSRILDDQVGRTCSYDCGLEQILERAARNRGGIFRAV